jgi:hypothetical protein
MFFPRSLSVGVGMHTTTLQRRMESFRLIINVFLYKVFGFRVTICIPNEDVGNEQILFDWRSEAKLQAFPNGIWERERIEFMSVGLASLHPTFIHFQFMSFMSVGLEFKSDLAFNNSTKI